MRYLLSIVIPTRNRQKYAIQSILQIFHVTDERVQIVVQDNSDDSSLKKMLLSEKLSDRVKYTYISKRISGVDNYAGGIVQSDGEYVCCIGDDDGVLRRIVDIVEWAKINNIAAVKTGVQASYIWPETSKDFPNGCLSLAAISSNFFYVNPQDELLPFLESGCIDFPKALLVKAYHGIVRKDMFGRIFEKTGKYCGGLSPDIYLSVALSLCSTSLFCIDIPFTIFGACRESTTGDSINRINVGKLEQAPHFIGQKYEWSDKVPTFYCGMNIWADSALHALIEMNAIDLLDHYSIEKLTCYCLLHYPGYRREIMDNFYNNHCNTKKLRAELIHNYPRVTVRKLKELVKKRKNISRIYRILRAQWQRKADNQVFMKEGVVDIIEAENIISTTIHHTIDTFFSNVILDKSGIGYER